MQERAAVAHDGRVRNVVVVLGLHDQHVAAKRRAGAQGAVALRRHGGVPVGGDGGAVELQLGLGPFVIAVQRRHVQRQPAHRAQRGQDGGQIAAIAAAHHRDGGRIDGWVGDQRVIGGHDVA
ncbi:Uncharacterised protein [Bordetella pertussis]|nr:Uncharacterised protein [Bordetella pertussis]